MRILVIQSDNRSQDSEGYHHYCSKINQLYCEKHGYDYHYEVVPPSHRHPSWQKLQVCEALLEQYDNQYDFYVYTDTDCIFKDFDVSIEKYIEDSTYVKLDPLASITFLNDQPWSKELPCAGFFIFTSQNKQMFQDWWNTDLPTYDQIHPFEQQALYENLNSYHFNVIDDWMFVEVKGQFIRHIGSQEGHNRLPYFTMFYNNLIYKNEQGN